MRLSPILSFCDHCVTKSVLLHHCRVAECVRRHHTSVAETMLQNPPVNKQPGTALQRVRPNLTQTCPGPPPLGLQMRRCGSHGYLCNVDDAKNQVRQARTITSAPRTRRRPADTHQCHQTRHVEPRLYPRNHHCTVHLTSHQVLQLRSPRGNLRRMQPDLDHTTSARRGIHCNPGLDRMPCHTVPAPVPPSSRSADTPPRTRLYKHPNSTHVHKIAASNQNHISAATRKRELSSLVGGWSRSAYLVRQLCVHLRDKQSRTWWPRWRP